MLTYGVGMRSSAAELLLIWGTICQQKGLILLSVENNPLGMPNNQTGQYWSDFESNFNYHKQIIKINCFNWTVPIVDKKICWKPTDW